MRDFYKLEIISRVAKRARRKIFGVVEILTRFAIQKINARGFFLEHKQIEYGFYRGANNNWRFFTRTYVGLVIFFAIK